MTGYILQRRKFNDATSVRMILVYSKISRGDELCDPLGIQLALAKKHHLPLFLHSRAAHADLVKILREEGFGQDGGRAIGANGGVVHSFTGTIEEAAELVGRRSFTQCIHSSIFKMDMGFHIG